MRSLSRCKPAMMQERRSLVRQRPLRRNTTMFRRHLSVLTLLVGISALLGAPITSSAQVAPNEVLAKGSVKLVVAPNGAPLITGHFFIDALLAPDGSASGQFLVFVWDIPSH